MSEATEAFRKEMDEKGLACPDPIIADGGWHRFHVDGDRPGSKNGSYKAYDDENPFIMFESWRTGERFEWSLKNPQDLSPQEQQRHRERIARAKEESERIRVERAREAAIKAQHIWDSSQPTSPNHPYLKRKQVQPHGIRVDKGTLIIPIYDETGAISSLQFIQRDGTKRFLSGGAISGNYFSLGEWTKTIFVCEGFATGATIYEATGCFTVVTFNCGNLKPVAEAVRQEFPNAQIILACDDDGEKDGNPGLTKGREASKAINGTVVYPTFQEIDDTRKPPTDFNDLMIMEGMEEVKKQLQPAEEMEIIEMGMTVEDDVLRQAQDLEADAMDETINEPSSSQNEELEDKAQAATDQSKQPLPSQNEEPKDEGQKDLESEIDRLANLSELDYAKTRKATGKRLGIGVTILDKLRTSNQIEHGQGKTPQGKEIVFDEPEPWDKPVDGGELVQRLMNLFTRFLVLQTGSAIAMSLWVIRAHAIDAFGTNPRLTLLSPEKRCGKTTTLDLISAVVPRPLPCSNISPSAIFRVIEKAFPTLILDEMDSFQDADEELRGILNSGHTRTAAFVIRSVGDDFEPRKFSTWCPMILAAIGSVPDTLEDRSIAVRMQRKKKNDKVERFVQNVKTSDSFKEEVGTIRRQCVRWVADHFTELQAAEPDTLTELSDRANDNWSGLFAIAKLCDGEWLAKAQLSAITLAGKEATSDTIGEMLLSDIKGLFKSHQVEHLSSAHLCDSLNNLEERPWAGWSRGKPITSAKIARLLDKYGIKSQAIREAGTVFKGYYKANFEDAWERYIPSFFSSSLESQDSKNNTVTTPMDKGRTPVFKKVTDPLCNALENGTLANTGAACNAVTPQNPESQGKEKKEGKKEGNQPEELSFDF